MSAYFFLPSLFWKCATPSLPCLVNMNHVVLNQSKHPRGANSASSLETVSSQEQTSNWQGSAWLTLLREVRDLYALREHPWADPYRDVGRFGDILKCYKALGTGLTCRPRKHDAYKMNVGKVNSELVMHEELAWHDRTTKADDKSLAEEKLKKAENDCYASLRPLAQCTTGAA